MTEKTPEMKQHEERQHPEYYRKEDVIDFRENFAILGKNWWKILSISLGAGFLTLVILLLMPNIYRATAVIAPVVEEQKNMPAIGALASTFGIQIGGPTKIEDLEALFRSNDLTVRVFSRNNLWPVVLQDRFDPTTGMMRVSWREQLLEREKSHKKPGDWDAIRAGNNALKVFINKKAGTITVAFESLSPEGSAGVLKHYIEEAKSRLQEEAFDRAFKNKKFIEEQIGRTVDPLTRERLFSLYGQEVEREMLAKNREQFGFRVIDSPRVPDRKAKPPRAMAVAVAFFTALLISSLVILSLKKKSSTEKLS